MERKEFEEKVAKLAKEVEKLINERAKKVIRSGCLDLASYGNDYKLPKLFICAMASEIRSRYLPHGTEDCDGEKEIRNIGLFL